MFFVVNTTENKAYLILSYLIMAPWALKWRSNPWKKSYYMLHCFVFENILYRVSIFVQKSLLKDPIVYMVLTCMSRGPLWREYNGDCWIPPNKGPGMRKAFPCHHGCALHWRHNQRDSVSNHQPHDCLLNRLFKALNKENIKAPSHWPLWGEFTGDRWIPRTKGQWRGKCFHLMTSSYIQPIMAAGWQWFRFILWLIKSDVGLNSI